MSPEQPRHVDDSRESTSAPLVRSVLLLISGLMLAQYAFAFAWWGAHRTEQGIRTHNPFTWAVPNNFSDLTDYPGKAFHLHGARALATGLPVFNYPAPAAIVYSLLFHTHHEVLVFSSLVIGTVLVLLGLLLTALRQKAVPPSVLAPAVACATVATLLSYPFEYVLWRSNLEGIAFIFFACGFVAFLTNRNFTAGLLWGCGICIKPFPVLLFLLLARRRKYLAIVVGLALAATAELIALHLLGPSIRQAFHDLTIGVRLYKQVYIVYFRPIEARFQHGILDSMKAACWFFSDSQDWNDAIDIPLLLRLYHIYLVVAAVLAGSTALWFWRKSFLNQIFAIVLIILLLAPVGADYTLVLLYLPFAAWLLWIVRDVALGRVAVSRTRLLAFAIPFAILFAPQNWLFFYTGILHTLALLALLAAAAVIPMPTSILGDLRPLRP